MAGTPPTFSIDNFGSVPSSFQVGAVPPTFTDPFAPSSETMFGVGAGGAGISSFAGSTLDSYMKMKQMELLQRMGIPVTGDPEDATDTPEAARATTEAAIAKIAVANPELAQQLADKMAQELPDGGEAEDNGFWGNLKELGGQILAPALAIGGKAMEILSRPAQIIPELIVDKDDDPWYEDVAQALSGKSTARGADVIEKWGVDNNIAKGVLGFALDVGGDPLTWATFGLAGVGRQVATKAAGKTAATMLIKEGLGEGEEATAKLIAKQLVDVRLWDTESSLGAAAMSTDLIGDTLKGEAIDIADTVMKAVQSGGLKKLPEQITLRSSGRVLSREQVLAEFSNARKAGLVKGTKAGYMQAKTAAAAQGGVRFRASIPFTPIRYISSAIPGTETLGFSAASRFFRGMSGMSSLVRGIDKGVANLTDLDIFLTEGAAAFRLARPEVAKSLGWVGAHPKSMGYSLAEQVGKITAHFSPHAAAYRGGGLAAFAVDANRAAASIGEETIGEFLTLPGRNGGPDISWTDNYKNWTKVLKPSAETVTEGPFKGQTWGDVQTMFKESVPLDMFNPNGTMIDPAVYFKEELAKANSEVWAAKGSADSEAIVLAQESLDEATAQLAHIKNLTKTLGPEQQNALWEQARLAQHIGERSATMGVVWDDITIDLDHANSLPFELSKRWARAGFKDVREEIFYVDAPGGTIPRIMQEGLGAQDKAYTAGTGHGWVASTKPPTVYKSASVEEFTKAQAKARPDMPVDRRPYITWADESPDEIKGVRTFLSADGKSGYGIMPDGEMVMAYNVGEKGKAATIPREQVENGGTYLNHFDDGLSDTHAKAGSKEISRTPFNDEFAPKGWDYAAKGRPDYIKRTAPTPTPQVPVRIKTRTPLTIDDRPGSIGHQSDGSKLAMIRQESEKVAREAANIHAESSWRMQDPEYVERWVSEKADELDSQALTSLTSDQAAHNGRPYDSIVHIDKDGNKTVTILDPPKKNAPKGIMVLDENAASPKQTRGYAPRVTVDDAARSIGGDKMGDFVYGAPARVHELERKFRHETFHEAEGKMRDSLLRSDNPREVAGNILERDPTKALVRYAERMAKAASEEQLGFSGRRLAYLGDLSVHATGGVTSRNLYKFQLNNAWVHEMGSLERGAIHFANQFEERYQRAAEYDIFAAQKQANEIANLHVALAEGVGNVGTQRVATSVVRLKQASRTTGAAVAKDIARANTRIESMKAIAARIEAGTYKGKRTIEDVTEMISDDTALIADLKRSVAEGGTPTPRASGLAGFVRDSHSYKTEEEAKSGIEWIRRSYNNEASKIPETKIIFDKERNYFYVWKKEKGAVTPSGPGTSAKPLLREAQNAEDLAARTGRVVKRQTKVFEAQNNHVVRLYTRAEDAMDEYNRVIADRLTHVDDIQAAFVPRTHNAMGMAETGISGLDGIMMPKFMADEFVNAWKGMSEIGDARRAWRGWIMGPWKKWATVMNPGFHARNNMGAWFNNFLGGVGPQDYGLSYRIRRSMKTSTNKYNDVNDARSIIKPEVIDELGLRNMFPEGTTVRYQDLGRVFANTGINSANSQAYSDIRTMTEEAYAIGVGIKKAPGAVKGAADATVGKVGGQYAKSMRGLTDLTENFHRTAAMVAGLRQTDGDLFGARAFVMMRHGDYLDLTDGENWIKDLLPFYKWMRTNTPYQIHNLLENPAAQLSIRKLRDAAFVAQGRDPDELRKGQQPWMRDEFAIPIPQSLAKLVPGLPKGDDGLSYMVLDLPMSDLYKGASEYASALLPVVRPVFESYVVKQNLFTGAPLEGKKIPLAAWAQVPGVKQALDAAGVVELNADGVAVWDDRVANLMSAIPVYSRFRNFITADPSRVKLRASAFTSFMFGIGLRPQEDEELTDLERAFYFNEVEPQLMYMKEMGVTLPNIDQVDASAFTFLGFEPPPTEPATPTV